MEKPKLKTIMIVIEETGTADGQGFNVYLAGDKERIDQVDPKKYGPAEFWASKLFRICCNVLMETGVVQTMGKKSEPKGGH